MNPVNALVKWITKNRTDHIADHLGLKRKLFETDKALKKRCLEILHNYKP